MDRAGCEAQGGRHRAPPRPERFNLVLLWVGQFINTAGLMMLVPIMPFYIEGMGVRDPRAVATWAGVAVAAPALALVVATPLWGRLGDRIGRRWMVVRALGGLAAAMVVMATATTPAALVLGRLLQGTLGGVVEAAAGFAGTTGNKDQRGAALGKSFSATAAGSLVGPLIGGALIGVGGLGALMVIIAALAAVLAVLSALGLAEPQRAATTSEDAATERASTAVRDQRHRWRLPVTARLAVAAAAAYLGVYGLIPIFADYTRGLVSDPASAGLWVGVAQSLTWGATLIFSPWWGRRNDRSARPVRTFAWAASICGVAIAAQALPVGLAGVLALRLVQGACFAALAQSLFFHAAQVASDRRAGGAVGSANSFLLAGQSLGPLLVGPTTVLLPVPVVIATLGGASLVGGLLAMSVARQESPAGQPANQEADPLLVDEDLVDDTTSRHEHGPAGGAELAPTTRIARSAWSIDEQATRPLPIQRSTQRGSATAMSTHQATRGRELQGTHR